MLGKEILQQPEYTFLDENEHLGKHIILLGLAGSYSYGTNNEDSDIDLRGVTLNCKSDLIGMSSFEQYVDDMTDTCIYSFNKMITLLVNCNPNTIELLGMRAKNYLFLNEIGQELLDHRKLFLSQKAVQSFGGYASDQLRRLQNALARDVFSQKEKEQHIFNSIKNAMYVMKSNNENFDNGSLKIYIDESKRPDFETEIFMDAKIEHYPLRDYKNMWAQMNNIVKDYDKIGKRNKKKDDHHLNKHAMHLIRLFLMGIDILEKEEINTYREKEQELLLDIRNGGFQKIDGTYRKEFYEMLSVYEKKLDYAAKNTSLPEEPDYEKIQEFVMSVNEKVVRDEI